MARNDDLHYILDKISTMNYEQFCAFVQCPQIQQLLKKRSQNSVSLDCKRFLLD